MTQPGPETADQRDDPVRAMNIQRVQRADGRYLIYYDWPDAGDEAERAADAPADEPQANV